MTRQDLVDNGYEDVVVFKNEDYEGCIVGVTTNNEAVYSKRRMVEWYMEQSHCSEEEALEWIEYNTEGSIGFEGSPIILELDEGDLVCYNKNWRYDMWQKIKDFFDKTVVQVIEVIVMILCAIGLAIGGWKGEDFHALVDYVGSAIIAILAVIKFIKTIMHRIGGD